MNAQLETTTGTQLNAETTVNSLLQGKINDYRRSVADENRTSLEAHHYRGGLVKAVRDAEVVRGGGIYGKGAVAKFHEAVGTTRSELYLEARFFSAFSKEDLQKILELPITWAHVKHVLQIDDGGDRMDLLKLAAEKKWTADEVRTEVRNRIPVEEGADEVKPAGQRSFNALVDGAEAVANDLARIMPVITVPGTMLEKAKADLSHNEYEDGAGRLRRILETLTAATPEGIAKLQEEAGKALEFLEKKLAS